MNLLRKKLIKSFCLTLCLFFLDALMAKQEEAPTFSFTPNSSCSVPLLQDSGGGAFNYLSGTFTAIRQKFASKNSDSKKTGISGKLFGAFLKPKRKSPEEEIQEKITRELSINANDFLKDYRDVVLELLTLMRASNKTLITGVPGEMPSQEGLKGQAEVLKPLTYESFVAEIQWRLLISKSLYNGREFFIIYLGDLPENKQLDFNLHSKDMVVVLPRLKSNGAEVFWLKGDSKGIRQFPGVMPIENLSKEVKPSRIEGFSKIYIYSEHYVVSNGWLLKQNMEVAIQEGWMPQVLSRKVESEAIRANPYDLNGVLALASGGGTLKDAWLSLGKSSNRQMVLSAIDSEDLRDSTLLKMDTDPEEWGPGFATDFLSLAAAYPLEVFSALQFEKFNLLIADTLQRLALLNQLRASGDKAQLTTIFYEFVAFMRENQGYIEGQLAELGKYKRAGELLKTQFLPIVEKFLYVHSEYSKKCAQQTQSDNDDIDALERRASTLKMLDGKIQNLQVALANIETSLTQLRTRENEYLAFFKDLEDFIQQFPSLVLNPDSEILVQEIQTLREAGALIK
ncbi:MAG: hypothetical protein KA116_08945 [Proteobacteria bacterium]|nr:hypothetical protein [Pseudomonadota bacterium]